MKKTACVIITTLATTFAAGAEAKPSIELWLGEGAIFDRGNRQLGRYRLELHRTQIDARRSISEVHVIGPNAKKRTMTCTRTEGPKGWSSICGSLRGGGHCFGAGLCIDYVGAAGQGFATTIVLDGKDRMRLLRTELKHGKAIRFFREALRRTVAR